MTIRKLSILWLFPHIFAKLLNLKTLDSIPALEEENFFNELRTLLKNQSTFKMWFKNAKLDINNNGTPCIIVPNNFVKLGIEKQFSEQLLECSNKILGTDLQIVVGSLKSTKVSQNTTFQEGIIAQNCIKNSKQERCDSHSFEDYISGPENQLAYYAAKNLKNDELYNSPFTVVGEHGTGKTHLASASVFGMKRSEVSLMHAEEFANSFIEASKSGNLESFRHSLRSKKIFILEDLDFFLEGNKVKTIDELMQTIKVFKRDRKQIIITSTRPLHDYERISAKLVHLLLSGLKVRLLGPSEKTRTKIISQYLKKNGIQLTPKTLSFIESIEFRNHRELLGALKQVVTFSKIQNEALPFKVVKEILSDHLLKNNIQGTHQQLETDLHGIAKCISKNYGVSIQKLFSQSRERHISEGRQIAMSLTYDCHYTLKEIGDFYGGRSHQTVLHSIRKIQQKIKQEKNFASLYSKLKSEISISE